VSGVALADFTFSTRPIFHDFSMQMGVRNLMNEIIRDPVSQEHLLAVMPQAGRSIFVKLTWRRED